MVEDHTTAQPPRPKWYGAVVEPESDSNEEKRPFKKKKMGEKPSTASLDLDRAREEARAAQRANVEKAVGSKKGGKMKK